MNNEKFQTKYDVVRNYIYALLFIVCLLLASASYASMKQLVFATPKKAVNELVSAIASSDNEKLVHILGKDAEPLIFSGDKEFDMRMQNKFLSAYSEMSLIETSNDAVSTLLIGKSMWAFPFPIKKRGEVWQYDTAAGKMEIIHRRIGRNELHTMKAISAYVDAQYDYFQMYMQYAQKLKSTENKRDGLYYPVAEGEERSPLGKQFAKEVKKGVKMPPRRKGEKHQSHHGYDYRILTSQGENAEGGAYDYVANGRMIAGHALIASPHEYGKTGVMTFIINQDGSIYEKDLGEDSVEKALKIQEFNPDSSWTKVTNVGAD